MKGCENNQETKIKVLGKTLLIKPLSEKMTYIEAEKLCKNGWRMLNVLEAGFIYDNKLIEGFGKEYEWIEHYSKETRKKGYGCSVATLYSDGVDDRLDVDGYWNGYGDIGYAFGVRLVKEVKR